ncbi:SixA phosphatase family protein [Methylocaldum szegediense]|uniref:Phosphohistidine phosphatase n=1 Tax=Methylocaldum szegediense TaxID=73780 RepID=A0ABM9I2L1_9GAMM|nr:histidine phosphatase family protein [Methylocaldum szegediense]CAI8848475.1 phosphohistidine phosphatase [Methylocaldum szegediense]
MKKLIVIRHAKSDRDSPSLADIDRPLNDRGRYDASLIGSILKLREMEPDSIISSPAKRALETAERVAEAVGYDKAGIVVRDCIYNQEVPALVELIRSIENIHDTACLIGHNPSLSELVARLTGENIGSLPTCGIAAIEFTVEDWVYILAGSGRLLFFDFPKRHR